MRIYIAGRYSRRDEFRLVRDRLLEAGHTVTSRWLDEDKPLQTQMGDDSDEFYTETSRIDLEDIYNSTAVLFFSENPLVGTPRGGRHVEFGYALAMELPIYVIGPRENVFHYNPLVHHYADLEVFLEFTNGR